MLTDRLMILLHGNAMTIKLGLIPFRSLRE
jgi:hypothetical protein